MLILSRRAGERILIDPGTENEIAITILSIKGNQARIGIDAPDDVTIHREEVADRIEREREKQGSAA